MDSKNFRKSGFEIIDYIASYRETLLSADVPVITNEKPGFMIKYVPLKAPENGEKWEDVIKDAKRYIIPTVAHWAHPHFHAYCPTGCSLVSVLGTLLTGAFGCTSDSWSTSPACTELEIIVVNWIAKLIGLPKRFLYNEEESKGGGCLQGSASECSLIILSDARRLALQKLKKKHPSTPDGQLLSSLTAYCSKEAHSGVEKACAIAMVTLRILNTDESFRFRGAELEEAIKQDLDDELNPFFVFTTFGTTSSAAVDKIDEIGPICKKYDLWLHVDGAYAASALICPEFRSLATGFEFISSLSMNPHKWLLIHFDCSVMWVDNRYKFVKALAANSDSIDFNSDTIDFRLWRITYRTRFRALKMWMTIRKYGVEGMRKHIRNHVHLAKLFKEFVEADDRFEIVGDVNFGVVCFRLKASADANAKLLAAIVASRKLYLVPSSLGGNYVLRFNISYEHMTEKQICYAWKVVTDILAEFGSFDS